MRGRDSAAPNRAARGGLAGVYASLVGCQTCATAAGGFRGGGAPWSRLEAGTADPKVPASARIRHRGLVRGKAGDPDPRTQSPALHAARLCEWAEDRCPAVCTEILTKYAGLSSKFTFGDGMTSMGDVRQVAAVRPGVWFAVSCPLWRAGGERPGRVWGISRLPFLPAAEHSTSGGTQVLSRELPTSLPQWSSGRSERSPLNGERLSDARQPGPGPTSFWQTLYGAR
jgi:hypothetical protein